MSSMKEDVLVWTCVPCAFRLKCQCTELGGSEKPISRVKHLKIEILRELLDGFAIFNERSIELENLSTEANFFLSRGH